jgi:superfamily II DNA or RNA helicase
MAKGATVGVQESRDLLTHGRSLVDQVSALENGHAWLRGVVEQAFDALREQMVHRELANIPVARLRETTNGRLRIGPLERVGITTVLDVYRSPDVRLRQISGVGTTTATQLVAAARQVATAVRDGLRIRVDLDPSDATSTALITALHKLRDFEGAMEQARDPARRLAKDLDTVLPVAAETGSLLRRFFSGRRRRDDAQAALARMRELVNWVESNGLTQTLNGAGTALVGRVDPAVAWREFERRSPEFYGLLGEIVEFGGDDEAAAGFLPAELVKQITSHPLDATFRRVSLRGYQAFGARFALSRRRVILGDEMGLGKTIEAIAVMAHLQATGARWFLVVCPASVLVNWTREISERSDLRAYRLHGLERDANQLTWVRQGGVGVTTLDSLYSLTVDADVTVDQLVVDEAHYVKNPQARRSQAVLEWTCRVDRVLFLTGTPMENRVEEFRNLVDYLQPELTSAIDSRHGIAGPTTFRRAVAPVYLRRNQDDVLMELPDLVRADDWVEFGRDDYHAYRNAVAEGNFMAMRRAAFAAGTAAGSAKLARLLEIVDESAVNGHKVVIFTNFRDVLATVGSALDGQAFGPIAGDVAPGKRQAIVDQFATVDGHAVLLAQIQAGGTGLNIQSASVAVICEPQVKPSLEEQAIARLHRMGQTRSVQAHRLLVADSVDQRMVEMLAAKSQLFADYARRSDMTEGSPDAVDISEVELARRIVAEEQERFARKAMARYGNAPTA